MTTMMIERVAMAIQAAVMLTHDEAKDAARAAMVELRLPTWKMKQAGADSYGQGRSWTGTWQAMIDSALKDDPTAT